MPGTNVQTTNGGRLTTDDDDVLVTMVMSQDVTERKTIRRATPSALHFVTPIAPSGHEHRNKTECLVQTASDVLDLPGVVFYDYDAERDRLVPEKTSREADFMRKEFPEVPSDDSSITGSVFSGGDPRTTRTCLRHLTFRCPQMRPKCVPVCLSH